MNLKRHAVASDLRDVCRTIRAFAQDEEGVAAIEYGLLASLIADRCGRGGGHRNPGRKCPRFVDLGFRDGQRGNVMGQDKAISGRAAA